MAKSSSSFSCAECGAKHSKWSGRCDACGAWNTIEEDVGLSAGPASASLGIRRGTGMTLSDLSAREAPPRC